MATQWNNLPDYGNPFMKEGQNSQWWFRFLGNLFLGLAPGGEIPVTLTGSPFTYTPKQKGFFILTGGTVSAVEFSRDGVAFYNYGATAGQFHLSANDRIRVTYSVAPTMTFVPT